MATMKIGKLIQVLEHYKEKFGDVPVVLWDLDSHSYFSLLRENFEAQRMEDGRVRISMGPNYYDESHEEEPAERPLSENKP